MQAQTKKRNDMKFIKKGDYILNVKYLKSVTYSDMVLYFIIDEILVSDDNYFVNFCHISEKPNHGLKFVFWGFQEFLSDNSKIIFDIDRAIAKWTALKP